MDITPAIRRRIIRLANRFGLEVSRVEDDVRILIDHTTPPTPVDDVLTRLAVRYAKAPATGPYVTDLHPEAAASPAQPSPPSGFSPSPSTRAALIRHCAKTDVAYADALHQLRSTLRQLMLTDASMATVEELENQAVSLILNPAQPNLLPPSFFADTPFIEGDAHDRQ